MKNTRNGKMSYQYSIRLILGLLVLSVLLTVLINVYKTNLHNLLFGMDYLSKLGFKKFWDSSDLSNLSLYLFSGQIAFAVLLGTAISFIAHLLENKHYGFKIKEILRYRFNDEFLLLDYIIINFMLVGISLILLFMKYSEIAITMIFTISLVSTIRVFLIIFNVFFAEDYLKIFTKRIISEELNSVKKVKDANETLKVFSNNIQIVEEIMNRIKDHTIEILRSSKPEEYLENVNFVLQLGFDTDIKSINAIETSIAYAGYFEDLSRYLYENKMEKELQTLLNNELLHNSCDPTLVSIEDHKVAEMFSTHYCQALASITKFNFYTQLSSQNSNFSNVIDNNIKYFNLIYNSSQKFQNQRYMIMQHTNWIVYISNSLKRLENYDKQNNTEYNQIYIDRMLKNVQFNTWSEKALNRFCEMSESLKSRTIIQTTIGAFATD